MGSNAKIYLVVVGMGNVTSVEQTGLLVTIATDKSIRTTHKYVYKYRMPLLYADRYQNVDPNSLK